MNKKENLLAFFIPHPRTHKKAHLLSWHCLVIYILLFVLLRVGIDLVSVYKPGVLGVNSSITIQSIIEGTNKERQQKGLAPLRENQALDLAAAAKARNMLEENYWAHFSPSGKDPWGFISEAGYKFSYAGENLARNFQTADDVVKAWMNSPSHRDNLLNGNYQDIGIAVVEGTLQGQKTTLVVQMFGRSYEPLAAKPKVDLGGTKVDAENSEPVSRVPMSVAGIQNSTQKAVVNPFVVTKTVGIFLVMFIALLLTADFIVLKRRGVFRLSSHHLAHLSFLALTGASLLISKVGEIL